jgi:hypothetical protein
VGKNERKGKERKGKRRCRVEDHRSDVTGKRKNKTSWRFLRVEKEKDRCR